MNACCMYKHEYGAVLYNIIIQTPVMRMQRTVMGAAPYPNEPSVEDVAKKLRFCSF